MKKKKNKETYNFNTGSGNEINMIDKIKEIKKTLEVVNNR